MRGSALCVPWLLAACNSHPGFPNGAPDGGPGDSASPTGDVAPEAVTLTVTMRGAPAQGVAVYFQNADSSLVREATTDEHGTAGAVLAAGGYVTVIEPDDGSGTTRLATFAATMPHDTLRLDLAPIGAIDSTAIAISVPRMMGAAGYQIYTSCGQLGADASGTASGQLEGCGGAVDVIVMANDQTASILGSLYVAGVTVGGQPAILNGLYDALVPTTFSYAGVPSSSGIVTTYQAIATARGTLFGASTSGSADAGRATSALDMPATTGTIALTVSSAVPASTEHGEQRVFDWGPPSSSYALDLASAMLPAFAAAPTYDPATRSISWTERTGGVPPDLVRARVRVFRDAVPEGRAWTWAILAPRGAGPSVALPRFPGGGFDFGPRAGDALDVDELTTARLPGGYASVRAHGFDDVRAFVAGPSGRLVAQSLYAPPL